MFSKNIGIDLGTANTLVYMKGKGIVMREPSVVAVDTKTDDVRGVGQEAKAMIGRTPGNIVAVRPLKDGVIADYDITANMLTWRAPARRLASRTARRSTLVTPEGMQMTTRGPKNLLLPHTRLMK